jgi:septal ring factor EnvC (AmiA/AmiB activator)
MEWPEVLPPDSTQSSREVLLERVRELEAQLLETQEKLAEAQAFIAELQRQLFGAKAEKLTAEQEKQLDELSADIREQAHKPPPLVQQVLEEEQRAQRRSRPRHTLPVALETETVTLEPENNGAGLSVVFLSSSR